MLSSWTALPLQIPFDILICFFLDFFHPLSWRFCLTTLSATCEEQISPAAFCTTVVKHTPLSFPLQKRSLLRDSSAHAVLPLGCGSAGKLILIISTASKIFISPLPLCAGISLWEGWICLSSLSSLAICLGQHSLDFSLSIMRGFRASSPHFCFQSPNWGLSAYYKMCRWATLLLGALAFGAKS